jgi:pyruvate formate lyase activating enzyme
MATEEIPEAKLQGLIFDIKRFAVHDGPGIRTTVFLKGCPLSCPWCQNPEGIKPVVNLWYFENKCIRCHHCIPSCPQGALSANPNGGEGSSPHIRIDRARCTLNGSCVQACPTEALAFDSRWMSVERVMEEVRKDRLFYVVSREEGRGGEAGGDSGQGSAGNSAGSSAAGGVTLSGGDPIHQHRFAIALLQACRDEGIDTAVETCLFASRRVLEAFIPVTSRFLVDIKLWDDEEHAWQVGRSNQPILRNFDLLVEAGFDGDAGRELTVRIPLIPGVTDSSENIRAIARFVRSRSARIPIELINFNPLAADKYRILGRDYAFASQTEPLPEARIAELEAVAREAGARVLS